MSRRCPGYEKNSIREMSMTQIQMMMPDAAAKSLQLCPTLCDPIDGSPPGSSIQGIFQARVLEWGAIAFSSKDPKLAKRYLKLPRLFSNVLP